MPKPRTITKPARPTGRKTTTNKVNTMKIKRQFSHTTQTAYYLATARRADGRLILVEAETLGDAMAAMGRILYGRVM